MSFDEIDALEPSWLQSTGYDDWVHCARYVYAEAASWHAFNALQDDPTSSDPEDMVPVYPGIFLYGNLPLCTNGSANDYHNTAYKLLKATTLDQVDGGQTQKDLTVYAYGKEVYWGDDDSFIGAQDLVDARLTGIYGAKAIESILDATPDLPPGQWPSAPTVNDILRLFTSETELTFENQSATPVEKQFRDCSDLSLRISRLAADSVWTPTLIFDFVSGDRLRSAFRGDHERIVIDRRSGSQREYHVYPYLSLPAPDAGDPNDDPICGGTPGGTIGLLPVNNIDNAAAMHYPYRYGPSLHCDGTNNLKYSKFDQTFWTTVVDELLLPSELAEEPYDPAADCGTGAGECVRGARSRKSYHMNPAGFMLAEKSWNRTADGRVEYDQVGYVEEFAYDCAGRMEERRTKGWSAAKSVGAHANQGLIYVFRYPTVCSFDENDADDDPCKCECQFPDDLESTFCTRDPDPALRGPIPRTPIAMGIKRGADQNNPANNPVYWLRRLYYLPEQTDLVEYDIQLVEPRTLNAQLDVPLDFDDPGIVINQFEYEFGGNPADEAWQRPIVRKAVVGPEAKIGPSSASYRPCDEIQFADGKPVWTRRGLRDAATGEMVLSFLDFNQYDSLGRLHRAVQDWWNADTGDPSPPSGWSRRPDVNSTLPESPDLPALNLTTRLFYDDGQFGYIGSIYPNGRELKLVYRRDANDLERFYQWAYRDLKPISGSPDYELLAPYTVTVFQNGAPERVIQVKPSAFDDTPDGLGAEADYDLPENKLTELTPTRTDQGVVSGMTQTAGGESLSSSILYSFNGEVAREVGPDGTITRYQYNMRGFLDRTYRGSVDDHPYWGTDNGGSIEDDMVLIEKRYYGDGVDTAHGPVWTNPDRPVVVRHYRDKPANQYSEALECPNGGPPIENNEDEFGWTSEYEYDWQMREVCVTRRTAVAYQDPCAAGNPGSSQPIGRELTWLDHAGRVRLTAVYSNSVNLGQIDPRNLGPAADVPDAAEVLGDSNAALLLSLNETLYNSRGLAEETRNYDVTEATGHEYTATTTYFDHMGRAIEVHAPGAPVQRFIYDAKGRQVRAAQFADTSAGLIEIARNQTWYDRNDRAVRTVRAERRADASGAELTAANSVQTFGETWYDDSGKVLATANYGTKNTAGVFVTGSMPWTDPDPNEDDQTAPPILSTAEMLVTRYEYDAVGRVNVVTQPDGSVARSQYDSLGRLTLSIEHGETDPPGGIPPANERRATAYKYDAQGRLRYVAAILPTFNAGAGILSADELQWDPLQQYAEHVQVTELIYGDGAVVVDSAGTAISSNRSWIQSVHYPNRTSGLPDPDSSLTFTYFSDGSLASRTDALGTRFRYRYSESSQLVDIFVDYGPPPELCPPTVDVTPPNRVSHVVFTYDDNDTLLTATAYTLVAGVETLLTQNAYAYGTFGNLLWERQALRAQAGTTSPQIDYDWEIETAYAGGRNFNRLDSMTYPKRLNGPTRRVIDLQYGTSGEIDDVLGRIRKLTDSISAASSSYTYAGSARRASLAFGAALIAQSFAVGGDLTGLDAFGRTKNLNYTTVSGPLHGYEYRYDLAGNRTHAKVFQQPAVFETGGDPDSHDNDRSYLYQFDGFQRLTSASLGKLESEGTIEEVTRAVTWSLDNLGNWAGLENASPTPPGMTITTDVGQSTEATVTIDHATVLDNALSGITRTPDGGSATTTGQVVNAAGSLVFDGSYFYQYDAWNRLVEVRQCGSLELTNFDLQGQFIQCPPPAPGSAGAPGAWLARYAYDGLGRLVEKSTPVIGGQDEIRREEYHYDGVRRIQELVRREATVTTVPGEPEGEPGGGEPGDPAPGELGSGGLGLEEPVETESLDPLAPVTIVTALPAGWDQTEYVWGPHYVDELAWQIDKNGKPYYAVLDANYNVMAVVAGASIPPAAGDPQGTQTVPAGTVIEQYVWSPHGELLCRDVLDRTSLQLMTDAGPGTVGAALPGIRNKVGHQGLFFERFDGLNTDPSLVPTDPVSGRGKGLYHARNRWYDATNGRFSSSDTNASGSPVLADLVYFGLSIAPNVDEFSTEAHYSDGLNRFAFARLNPILGGDPSGLVYDPFEEVDAVLADIAGERAATASAVMSYIGSTYNTALALGKIVWSMVPFSGTINLTVALARGDEVTADMIFDAVGDALIFGRAALSFARNAGKYASRSARLEENMDRNSRGLAVIKGATCNSLASGTLIETPSGDVPIEVLQVGDWILARHQSDSEDRVVARRVTAVFHGESLCMEWIQLSNDRLLRITPNHEVFTTSRGWLRSDELIVGDSLIDFDGGPVTVISLKEDPTPVRVYNISVDGVFTYYAYGVWVHNCIPADVARIAAGHAWTKHHGDFTRHGINTPNQLADHIMGVAQGSAGRQLSGGRLAWYDNRTGMVVIHNPGREGTAFIPEIGYSYFLNLR